MIKLKSLLIESLDIGYHRGNGGIASDTTQKRMDSGRSTGHFGTGTYFVGNPELATGRGDRPLLKFDLSGLTLAKPRGHDAIELHNTLRLFNIQIMNNNPLTWGEPRLKAEQILFRLCLILFGTGKREVVKNAMLGVEKLFRDKKDDGFKTPSTYLMQSLGFQGIDVRGTPADNTMYGSVIYPNGRVNII
jgi:hypothetical protein